MPVPVHGPYHAAHLHSSLNTDKIMHVKDARIQKVLEHSKPRFPVMSCATGTWYSEQGSVSLIQAVIRDILTRPLQFQKVLHGSVLKAQNYRGAKCLVIPFGQHTY
jgi:iron transport multicopper oxidase